MLLVVELIPRYWKEARGLVGRNAADELARGTRFCQALRGPLGDGAPGAGAHAAGSASAVEPEGAPGVPQRLGPHSIS